MLYICTKFHENISKGFRVMEGLDFQYSKFSKGHNSVKKCQVKVIYFVRAITCTFMHGFQNNLHIICTVVALEEE